MLSVHKKFSKILFVCTTKDLLKKKPKPPTTLTNKTWKYHSYKQHVPSDSLCSRCIPNTTAPSPMTSKCWLRGAFCCKLWSNKTYLNIYIHFCFYAHTWIKLNFIFLLPHEDCSPDPLRDSMQRDRYPHRAYLKSVWFSQWETGRDGNYWVKFVY